MNRNHYLDNKGATDEEKLANIIVGHAQVDETMSLMILDHFFDVSEDAKRKQFENFILIKMGNREKISVLKHINIDDPATTQKLVKQLVEIGEIRNKVAHDTAHTAGLLVRGLVKKKSLDELYQEFSLIMDDLESFIDDVYSSHNNSLDHWERRLVAAKNRLSK